MTMKLKCPVCGSMGTLMQKTTKTKTTTGEYKEYRYWYIYHGKKAKKPWCYLTKENLSKPEIKEALKESATQITTQTTQKTDKPKLASNLETSRAGSLARIGHEPPKLGVVGSNPTPPAKTRKKTQ